MVFENYLLNIAVLVFEVGNFFFNYHKNVEDTIAYRKRFGKEVLETLNWIEKNPKNR